MPKIIITQMYVCAVTTFREHDILVWGEGTPILTYSFIPRPEEEEKRPAWFQPFMNVLNYFFGRVNK